MKEELPTMPSERQGIKSVEHGMRVVEALLSLQGPAPLKELASRAKMSSSAAHRYLVSLIRSGMVQQHAESGHYRIGPLAVRIGINALAQLDDVGEASRQLEALVHTYDIDGHVSVWGDNGPTIVRIHASSRRLLTNLRLGGVLPLLTSATGKVFAAFMPHEVTKEFIQAELARMPNKHTPEWCEALRQETLTQGFGSASNTLASGMNSVSVPVFDFQGDLRASISLVGPDYSLSDLSEALLQDLKAAGERASMRLGWNPGTQDVPEDVSNDQPKATRTASKRTTTSQATARSKKAASTR